MEHMSNVCLVARGFEFRQKGTGGKHIGLKIEIANNHMIQYKYIFTDVDQDCFLAVSYAMSVSQLRVQNPR